MRFGTERSRDDAAVAGGGGRAGHAVGGVEGVGEAVFSGRPVRVVGGAGVVERNVRICVGVHMNGPLEWAAYLTLVCVWCFKNWKESRGRKRN